MFSFIDVSSGLELLIVLGAVVIVFVIIAGISIWLHKKKSLNLYRKIWWSGFVAKLKLLLNRVIDIAIVITGRVIFKAWRFFCKEGCFRSFIIYKIMADIGC